GVTLTPRVASDFADNEGALSDEAARRLYAPQGRMLRLGERLRNPALAKTLRGIARDGRSAFYDGAIAADMAAKLRRLGGLHTVEDFARHRSEYVTPIAAPYRRLDVLECPPNGQGIAALMILRVLSGFDFANLSEADRIHVLAEATKAAYAERDRCIGDPAMAQVQVEALNSDAWAERVRVKIRLDRAGAFGVSVADSHTVYLCIVDRDGNAISFINSIFHEFGSGILAPEAGVLLHSRGSMFRTTPGHPNAIAPGQRPLHTIIPAMLMAGGAARMPFGVMGGNYQATGHAQLLTHMLDLGLDPQAALEAPRSFAADGVLGLERTIPRAVAQDLAARGHKIGYAERPFGGGQAIWIDERGWLVGGSDPRKDGMALGF
ncbi:MAG: gamma-glutamyltransferase family protein, partial [Stellaceae bacterium]